MPHWVTRTYKRYRRPKSASAGLQKNVCMCMCICIVCLCLCHHLYLHMCVSIRICVSICVRIHVSEFVPIIYVPVSVTSNIYIDIHIAIEFAPIISHRNMSHVSVPVCLYISMCVVFPFSISRKFLSFGYCWASREC